MGEATLTGICAGWVCACSSPLMLADTEDWAQPLCLMCWIEAGEPEEEPEKPVNTASMERERIIGRLLARGETELAKALHLGEL